MSTSIAKTEQKIVSLLKPDETQNTETPIQESRIKQIYINTTSSIKETYQNVASRIEQIYLTTVTQITSCVNICVEKSQSLAGRIKYATLNVISDLRFEMTETKIKQIILSAFSGYTLLVAKSLSGSCIPTTFLQLCIQAPFLALSAGALWYAMTLIDYENPVKLEKVRIISQKLPLKDLLHLHGWQNLFRYEILNPEEFNIAFSQYATSLNFRELYALYTEAKEGLALVQSSSKGCQHKIPDIAAWKDKFKEEIVQLTPEQAFTLYPDLLELNLLSSPDEIASFREVQTLMNAKIKETEAFSNKISGFLEDAEKASLGAIQHAQNTLAEIDRARISIQEGSEIRKEKLPYLGEEFDGFRRKANEEHEQKTKTITARLQEIANHRKSSPPIKA